MSLNKHTIRGYKTWLTRTKKAIEEEEESISIGLGSRKTLKALKQNQRFYEEKINEEKKDDSTERK